MQIVWTLARHPATKREGARRENQSRNGNQARKRQSKDWTRESDGRNVEGNSMRLRLNGREGETEMKFDANREYEHTFRKRMLYKSKVEYMAG